MRIAVMTFRLRAPWAHSLMDEISRFVEENCEAELVDEQREIR